MKEAYGCYDQFPRDKPQRRVLRGGGIKFCVYVKKDVTVDHSRACRNGDEWRKEAGEDLF